MIRLAGVEREGLFGRLRMCVAGYLVSAIAASLGILACLIAIEQAEARSLETLLRLPGEALDMLFRGLPGLLYAVIALTILPSAIFILVAELALVRHWQAYVAFGAALGPAEFLFLARHVLPNATWSADDFLFLAIAAMAGAFGGLAYWHVAIQRPFSRVIAGAPPDSE